MAEPTRVAAVLACHNRRDQTVACLRSLLAQAVTDVELALYLTDDGSTDGTGDAVAALWPGATILRGDGSLFWNGGMRLAFDAALRAGHDHYLWLNDDTGLEDGALTTLLDTYRAVGEGLSVVVGSVRDPETGVSTYGGVEMGPRWAPFRFSVVPPGPQPKRTETMHGNVALVPDLVARTVGGFDPGFTHAMGDFDYGLRVNGAGGSVWTTPGFVATCPRNPPRPRGRPGLRAARDEWRRLMSPKGLPPADWRVFTRRHGGRLWPLWWASPYVRRTLRALLRG